MRFAMMFAVLSLAALSLAAVSPSALAGRGVIVEKVPAAVDRSETLRVVQDRLQALGWTVVGQNANAVWGRYVGQNIEVRLRVFIDDGTLRYEESATDLGAARRGAHPATSTPARWINAIRSEVDSALRARAATLETSLPPASPPKRSHTDRLEELRKMLDAGLITNEDYEKKRAEILKDL
jgi:hypothetical protein